ncbi:MAG: rod shape-determining protein RodA [Saprospiraceae bacterium]
MKDFKNTATGIQELDYILLTCYIALVMVGWVMIYSASGGTGSAAQIFDLGNNAGKQLFFIIFCAAIFFFIQMSDWAFWRTLAIPFYLISLVFLAGTIVLGREVNGANAWYQFGGFSFQPSEVVKFSTCLAVAGYLSATGVTLRDIKPRIYTAGLFLFPALIILLQNDTGSALVFFSFVLVMYREGLPSGWYALGFGTAFMVILGLMFPAADVAAVLMLVASVRIISEYQNARPWWVAALLLAPLVLWWRDVSQWVWPLVSKYFLHKPQTPGSQAAELPFGPQWVMVLPLLFLLVVFLKSYLRKPSLIQRRLQLIALVLTLACGEVFLAQLGYSLMAPHQQQRIRIWLNPSEATTDARGSAYNLLHSKMAIGSGGFFGKGPLNGNMTKLKYVPEQSTDFIFCTVGEEHGFVGVVGVVGLFFVLLYRITQLAERQRSNFSRIYAYGVAGVIFVHVIINIGMTMGLFPIIGIPLPFISSGGSSLIGFTLMIGVLLKLDSRRNLA